MTVPKPPDDLSARSRTFWASVMTDEVDPSPADVELFAEACRALDRADAARQHVAEHGVVVLDRYDVPKANPAVDIEHRSRAFFAAACKQLGLNSADEEPTPAVPRGRPGPKPRRLRAA